MSGRQCVVSFADGAGAGLAPDESLLLPGVEYRITHVARLTMTGEPCQLLVEPIQLVAEPGEAKLPESFCHFMLCTPAHPCPDGTIPISDGGEPCQTICVPPSKVI